MCKDWKIPESLCLTELWTLFLHSNECFCLFVILYVMFLITVPSSAHIYHLSFSTSWGMLTVQQRQFWTAVLSEIVMLVYFIRTRVDKCNKQIYHGQSLKKMQWKSKFVFRHKKGTLFQRCLGVTRGHCTVFIDQPALLKAQIVAYLRILVYMPRRHWK